MRARMTISALAFGLALASVAAASPPPPPADTAGAAASKAPPPPVTAPPSGGAPTAGPTAPRGAAPPPPPANPAPTTPEEAPPERVDPVDLSGTWGYSRSVGLQPRVVQTRDDVDAAPNPDGYYSGVSIEGNHVPPFPASRMGTKPASMTWTGFERVGEGSRVFFEVSADVPTKLDVKAGVVTVRLGNTRINVRNNARFLDLRYFRTPVRSVKVTRRGKDAVATIVLKRAAEPKLSWIAGKAGYRLLVIEFAGGAASDAAAQSP